MLALTRFGRMGASSRLRFLQFIDAMQVAEPSRFTFTVSPFLGDDDLRELYETGRRNKLRLLMRYLRRAAVLTNALRYDVIWLEKEIFPGLPAMAERVLKLLGCPIVVDYDDGNFVWYTSNSSPLVRRFLRHKIEAVCDSARRIVVANPNLRRRLTGLAGGDPLMVPTPVDLARYTTVRPTFDPGRLAIGWIGSPTTAKSLRCYEPALAAISRLPGASFVSIGAGSAAPGFAHRALPWSEALETQELPTWSVAVAPIEQCEFAHYKSGYKILQCMASGLPVIASPVGVANDIITHRETGFLASSAGECHELLLELRSDPQLCARVGAAARARVAERYSLEGWRAAIADTLSDAARANRQGARRTARSGSDRVASWAARR